MLRSLAAIVAAALWTSGCAYVGSPLPPLANVPSNVTGLAAVQRASNIIVHFTVPTLTTEGFPVRPGLKLDLRIGPVGISRDHLQPVSEGSIDEGLATYIIPSAEWTGKAVTIAVRALAPNGKPSAWEELTLPVVAAPATPAGLKADSAPEGGRLTWNGPAGDFRVFRRAGDDQSFAPVAEAQQPDWTDRNTELGKRYTYLVQRIVKLADNREAESEPSTTVEVTAADSFPPAAPVGLRANAAPASVELSWDRSTETDLAGYRVYRALAGGDFEKLADVSQIPSYSDQRVEHGKTYRYAISAVDQAGNESTWSAVAEVPVP
jgi:hypothetical protein